MALENLFGKINEENTFHHKGETRPIGPIKPVDMTLFDRGFDDLISFLGQHDPGYEIYQINKESFNPLFEIMDSAWTRFDYPSFNTAIEKIRETYENLTKGGAS